MRRNFDLIKRVIPITVIALSLVFAGNALAQNKKLSGSVGLYVYPANNQSAELQGKDDYECFNWAQGQTGHNPMNPQPIHVEAAPSNTGPDGSAVRGAARGAILGEIADDDAGKGAAWGAAVGARRGRKARQAQAQQSQVDAKAQAQQMEQQRDQEFKNAFSACLTARGYSVN
jgi:hypothetical protein